MRIALVTETFLPAVNGVTTRLRETIRRLAGAGDDVIVFAPGQPASIEGARVQGVWSFPLPMYPEASFALPGPSLRRRLADFRPDVVHAVNPLVLGMAGVYYAQQLGLPLVASFHTNFPRYLRYYGLGVFENAAWELVRAAHSKATLNLSVSRAVEVDLVEHGIPAAQARWRGGVDTELYHPCRATGAVRTRLSGGAVDAPLLLYVGRLSPEKDVGFISEIMEGLRDARLALVGDGPHRPALEEHFAGRAVHFEGYLAGAELAAAYASADLLVFPSQTDTYGLVLLEALASGCPVLAVDAGGAPDIVPVGSGGELFRPGDRPGAVAAARRLLAGVRSGPSIRLQARSHAEGWTWEAATDELRHHYRAAIASRAISRAA